MTYLGHIFPRLQTPFAHSNGVVIRTNSASTTLTIDAPLDTVNHYGEVGKVDAQRIDLNHCYNEYGKAAFIKLTEGKVVAKTGGEITVCYAANNDSTKVRVFEDGGNITAGYTNVEQVDTANQSAGGIELAYKIDDTIDVNEFIVEGIGSVEVEKAKTEEDEKKTGKGPWGTIISANENFWGGLLLNVGDEYDINDITNGLWDVDPEEGTFTTSSNPDVVDIEIEYDFSFEAKIVAKHLGETIINLYDDPLEESESDPSFTIKVTVIDTLEYEASIGDTNYATIEQAFEAALSMDNATVKLLGFVNRSSSAGISIASGNWVDDPNDNVHESNKDQIFEGRKSLTLDLNGNTLHTDLLAYDVNLTIIDSSEDKIGKIDGNIQCGGSASRRSFSEQDQEYVDYDWSYLSTYHLNGGTYKTFNMVGNVNVVINGASIICTEPTPNTATIASNGACHSDLTIIYGAFSSVDTLFSNHPDNTYEIRGGYFSRDITDLGVLAPGYSCVNVGGLYKVVLGD